MNFDAFLAFCTEFSPTLGKTKRWDAFCVIAKELFSRDRAVYVLETGCVRTIGNWIGDGQSTLVWDWIINKAGGNCLSLDINEQNVVTANSATSKLTVVLPVDSIHGIRTLNPDIRKKLDLLYLDSFDCVSGVEAVSALHHAGELASCWELLPSGCLVAVDDCVSSTEGKHVLVKQFFELLKIKPIHESYVTVWKKP